MRWAVRVLLVLAALAYFLGGRPSGLAAEEPVEWQRDPLQVPTDREPFDLETSRGRVTLTPRAGYDIAAVVERAEPYWLDATAFLSPYDLALAWGDVPRPEIRNRLEVDQSWRFFFWRTSDPSIDVDYVIRHSANTHVIPASPNVRRALSIVDESDEIRIRGLLVDVTSDRGLTWKTSLVRSDHGDRGCEILWAESIQIGDRVYE